MNNGRKTKEEYEENKKAEVGDHIVQEGKNTQRQQ